MARPVYKMSEGSLQHRFQLSRNKVQIMGGGFANGKSAGACIKALNLARDYPGSNGLIARSTYPKLNDTIRKEFLKWCPRKWIKRQALSVDNIVELTNGSIINFRYVAQHGKSNESSTSNLLSATYDWALVDQIEDPEISEKDFDDLLGRLRGMTPYAGQVTGRKEDGTPIVEFDPTMPTSGPRWLILTTNPTRNWVYRKLVKPLHDYKIGISNPDLFADIEGKPLIDLFEGPTHENAENLEPDYIATLEAKYKGQMRTRYLLGEWGAFEGLVYPQYDANVHPLDPRELTDYFLQLIIDGFEPTVLEAYDHGIAMPACYGLGFADHLGNVFIMDGYYEKEKSIEWLASEITNKRKALNELLGYDYDFSPVLADPQVFRRTSGNSRTVGTTVAGLFRDHGVAMVRANNDIMSGIAKVQSYLEIDKFHKHPITGNLGSPRLFFNNELTWIDSEIVDYYWKKDTSGEYEDTPNGVKDHAMDKIKYLLTHRPKLATFVRREPRQLPRRLTRWTEREVTSSDRRSHRHAA